MSDEDSRTGMEDVLASIRRLVDTAPESRAKPERPARDTAPSAAEAEPLVLTPEMRVDTPPPEPAIITEPAEFTPAVPQSPDTAATPEEAAEPEAAAPAGEAEAPVVAEIIPDPVETPVPVAAPGLTEADVETIVRRVIREELEGPLGQVLSDNLRALIATEISRAGR